MADDGTETIREILQTQANGFDHISPDFLEQIYELETELASFEERHKIEGQMRKIIEDYKKNNDF